MASSEPTSEVFSLGLLNINSLRNKLHKVKLMITNHKLHVLALCETHLDDTVKDSKLYIEGFRLWRKDRDTEGRGGGVAIYVQEHIETKLRPDLMNPDVEIIWVQMLLSDSSRPVLVGCCYRPPTAKKLYLYQIQKVMNQVSKEEKDIFLMGDFNINWFAVPSDKDKNSRLKKSINSLASQCGLTQIVTVTTRETQSGERQTCIDHIYTNIKDKCYDLESFPGYSDHNLITVEVMKTVPELIMSGKRFDENDYIRDLMKVQWTDVFKVSDPQEALTKFSQVFVSVADKHTPLKTQRIYDSLVVDGEVTRTQTESFREQLQAAGNDPEKIFPIFKKFVGHTMSPHVINAKPGSHFTPEEDFLNYLNQTHIETEDFTSVFGGFQHQINMEIFSFKEVDAETVKSLLLNICGRLDRGINAVDADLFRAAADVISHPLCNIINRCIRRGVFPSEFKEIEITLFSTKEYTSIREKSRVEILHLVLGLIFDVILLMQTKQYFTDKELIPSLQDQHDQVKREWNEAIAEGKTVKVAFLDFSPSFDTISHDLIIKSLESHFSDSALDLIKSYLSNTQTDRGLPRGSFFAHFLFTVSTNNLKQVLKRSSAVECGNEMVIYYADDDIQEVKDVLKTDKKSVFDWAQRENMILKKKAVSTTSRTRQELSEIFQLLESVRCCDQGQLNWIRALRVILHHNGPYWKRLYSDTMKKLEQGFTKTRLDDIPIEVKKQVINSLVLLNFDPLELCW